MRDTGQVGDDFKDTYPSVLLCSVLSLLFHLTTGFFVSTLFSIFFQKARVLDHETHADFVTEVGRILICCLITC